MSIIVEGIHHPLFAELSAIVGPKYCSDEAFVRLCYSRDSSPAPAQVQGIVVRPANIEQVVQIVKLANYARTPIVPSGGRAALYGAPPGIVGKGIVVDMTRMRKVLRIDEVNTLVTVEAGITLAEMTDACEAKGWHVHTAAQPYFADTVGGQISGVLGAGLCLEGTGANWNGHHVTSVKVVLPTGEVIQTGAGPGTNINMQIPYAQEPGGPMMTGMFIGAAGVFGIVVEATYRMYRAQPFIGGVMGIFTNKEDALGFAFDMSEMPTNYVRELVVMPPTKTFEKQGVPPGWFLSLNVFDGMSQQEIDLKVDLCNKVVEKHNGMVSQDPKVRGFIQDAKDLKRHREMGSFASLGVWTYLEVVTPREDVSKCIDFITHVHQDVLDAAGVQYESNLGCLCVGGANQWIMTSIIFLKGDDKKAMDLMYNLWKDGLIQGPQRGWYADANQGWGSITMAKFWPPETAVFMRAIKKALDPNNIMNPGVWGL